MENFICYPVNTNVENFGSFEGFEANTAKTLIGTFTSAGLNYRDGFLGNRDNWENSLGVNYNDANNQNIEGSLNILREKLAQSNPMMVEFAKVLPNGSEELQFKMIYGGHYDDFNGGRHALFQNTKTLYKKNESPEYANNYRMYYYPQVITPTNPMATPAGYTKFTVVTNGEVQFFNNSTQVCLVNDGQFPKAPAMNNKKVIAKGLPDNTVITGYTFETSKFNGKYQNAIFVNLSNTVDVTTNDGFFFIESPPPPPPPPAPPAAPPAPPAAPAAAPPAAPAVTPAVAPAAAPPVVAPETTAPVSSPPPLIAGSGAGAGAADKTAGLTAPAPQSEDFMSKYGLYLGIAGAVIVIAIIIMFMMGGKKDD
jgi:hypothetical protein